MSMTDIKTNVVNSHPHQVELGTLGALGHSEDRVFRGPWRYTLPLWSMSMQICASWINNGTLELSDNGLGETFEMETSLEAEFMWKASKRRDGVRLGSGGRNRGENSWVFDSEPASGVESWVSNESRRHELCIPLGELRRHIKSSRRLYGQPWYSTSGLLE
ncbi:hypothetical protein KI387_033225 [Taxus chinensis]|uniref:Uncharacterized protein n=1 Tax=Taxus chinensis TaxID=29808 RepID=A0AA38BXE4_TAXCH|nr:hypothetical protein KI387_033225 [Taxus chinensis]